VLHLSNESDKLLQCQFNDDRTINVVICVLSYYLHQSERRELEEVM